jgi:peptidoglycan/LPS O-acetylase OafA/YrhL
MPQLTFTRFIAAILIVLFHFGQNTSLSTNPIINLATAGVSYFFLLSGFILSSVYYKNTENLNKKQYYLKRFVRIYPVYILALLILISFIFLTKQTIDFKAVFLQIFLLQSWFPDFVKTLNIPSWSLSVEVFFYLLFPFLINSLKQIRKKWLITLIGLIIWFLSLIIYYYGLNSGLFINFFNYNPLLHLNSFILGIISYLLFKELKPISPIRSLFCTFSPLIIIALLLIIQAPILHYNNNGLLAPLFAIFLFGLASDQSYLSKFLSFRPFIILGEISYAIYILQVPLYAWWDAVSNRYLNNYQNLQLSGFIILLIVVSWISFKLIEEPIRKYLKQKIN